MRLIDADLLVKDLEKRWDVNDDQDFCNKEVWNAISEASTKYIPELPQEGEQ